MEGPVRQAALHFVRADIRSEDAHPGDERQVGRPHFQLIGDDYVSARLHFELDIEGEPRRVQFVEIKQAGTGAIELHVPADQPVPISHRQLRQVSENYFRRALSAIEHTHSEGLGDGSAVPEVQSIEIGKWYTVDLSP
jgi:hypothetical protein